MAEVPIDIQLSDTIYLLQNIDAFTFCVKICL